MRAPEPVSASILEGYLGVRSALISEILTSFEAHGYIERVRSRENHRVKLLHPTSLGRKLFRRLETEAVIKLRRCLREIPSAEQHRIYEILKRFAGEWGRESIFLAQSLSTRRISAPAELRTARAFLFREIVARGWENDAPDPLFPTDCQIWGLFEQTSEPAALKALCISKAEKSRWSVRFGICREEVSRNQFNAFLHYAHYLEHRGRLPAPLTIECKLLENQW